MIDFQQFLQHNQQRYNPFLEPQAGVYKLPPGTKRLH